MSHLIIDCGNTRTKWRGATQGGEQGEQGEQGGEVNYANNNAIEEFARWLARHPQQFTAALVAGSSNHTHAISAVLHQHQIPTIHHLSTTGDLPGGLPLTIDYHSPQTLGLDRIATALCAEVRFPHRAKIVVDLGTAITIDHIDANGHYRGGNISPGLSLRLKALHHHTDKLPLITPHETLAISPLKPWGQTTHEAIILGAVHGICNEIQGYIQQNPNIFVYFTGGDAKYFENLINFPIFVDSQACLNGLEIILNRLCQDA